MDIQVSYQPTPEELAKASSLFIEKKPFLLFTVGLVNFIAGILFLVLIVKMIKLGLNAKEWVALLGGGVWLFGRRPFNEWLLYRRMKNSPIQNQPITVELTGNGIIWSGKSLLKGNMSWKDMKYVFIAKNGFIFPHSGTRFLWLPFRAFLTTNDVDTLKKFIVERGIVVREFPKWEC